MIKFEVVLLQTIPRHGRLLVVLITIGVCRYTRTCIREIWSLHSEGLFVLKLHRAIRIVLPTIN